MYVDLNIFFSAFLKFYRFWIDTEVCLRGVGSGVGELGVAADVPVGGEHLAHVCVRRLVLEHDEAVLAAAEHRRVVIPVGDVDGHGGGGGAPRHPVVRGGDAEGVVIPLLPIHLHLEVEIAVWEDAEGLVISGQDLVLNPSVLPGILISRLEPEHFGVDRAVFGQRQVEILEIKQRCVVIDIRHLQPGQEQLLMILEINL